MVPKRPVALARAQWLAELAEAIDQAEQLAWRLGFAEGDSAEARALHIRLGTLRAEIETLRGAGRTAVQTEIDPLWTRLLSRP
jgi:hypothetical protein